MILIRKILARITYHLFGTLWVVLIDFNGDAKSDILVQDTVSGALFDFEFEGFFQERHFGRSRGIGLRPDRSGRAGDGQAEDQE